MSSRREAIATWCLISGLGACAAHPVQHAPLVTPALVVQAPPVEGTPAASNLVARVARADATREAIAAGIEVEDAPRKGKAKTLRVADQVGIDLERAKALAPPSPYVVADVQRYEEACAKLEASYLASLLESTDPTSQATPFMIDATRDVLGSASVDEKLAAWQAQDPAHSVVKFAVVRGQDGRPPDVRVGPLDVSHVDIAGGLALSAGLLRTARANGRTYVSAFENTSGGFRPGPLRNRTTFAALQAAGYLPASASELRVYDNPSGGYPDSKLFVIPR